MLFFDEVIGPSRRLIAAWVLFFDCSTAQLTCSSFAMLSICGLRSDDSRIAISVLDNTIRIVHSIVVESMIWFLLSIIFNVLITLFTCRRLTYPLRTLGIIFQKFQADIVCASFRSSISLLWSIFFWMTHKWDIYSHLFHNNSQRTQRLYPSIFFEGFDCCVNTLPLRTTFCAFASHQCANKKQNTRPTIIPQNHPLSRMAFSFFLICWLELISMKVQGYPGFFCVSTLKSFFNLWGLVPALYVKAGGCARLHIFGTHTETLNVLL